MKTWKRNGLLGVVAFIGGFAWTNAYAQELPHVPDGCSYPIPGAYDVLTGLTDCDYGSCPEGFPAEVLHTEDPDHPAPGELCSHDAGYNPVIRIEKYADANGQFVEWCVLEWNRLCAIDNFGTVEGIIWAKQRRDGDFTGWNGSYEVWADGLHATYEMTARLRDESANVYSTQRSCEELQSTAARRYYEQFLLDDEKDCAAWDYQADNNAYVINFRGCPGPALTANWFLYGQEKNPRYWTWFPASFLGSGGQEPDANPSTWLSCECVSAEAINCHLGE